MTGIGLTRDGRWITIDHDEDGQEAKVPVDWQVPPLTAAAGDDPEELGLELRRRPRAEVLELLPPMVTEAMKLWEEMVARVGWRGGFHDFQMKLLEMVMLVEVVLPDAPTEDGG